MNNVIRLPQPTDQVFVKISRNGEAFWIRDIVVLELGIYKGIIDSDVGEQRVLNYGDTIAFVEAEVGEIKRAKVKEL